ncbi:MAG: acetyltransferase [Bacteroidales bacterium]|nr:acetyltransferase [Bacteroidales bacterium]
MVIIGAGNLGKHILEILLDEDYNKEIIFFDEKKPSTNSYLGAYKIENDIKFITSYFKQVDNRFVVGIGQNRIREKMVQKFRLLGGHYTSVISQKAFVSPLIRPIETQVIIQPGAGLSNNIVMGEGCVIHANSIIGHDVKMGKYVSVATLTTLIGPCEIGDYSFIGTNCVVMPGIKIGKHVVVGASVKVNRNVNDYETLV